MVNYKVYGEASDRRRSYWYQERYSDETKDMTCPLCNKSYIKKHINGSEITYVHKNRMSNVKGKFIKTSYCKGEV